MQAEPSVRVVFDLSEKDRGLLTEILQELKNARPNCERCVQQMGESVERCIAAKPESILNQHPIDAVPPATKEDAVPWDDEPKASPVKTYSQAEVQAKVMALCQGGKKPQVKAILNDYAANVSGLVKLPAEKIAEFMTRLEAVV